MIQYTFPPHPDIHVCLIFSGYKAPTMLWSCQNFPQLLTHSKIEQHTCPSSLLTTPLRGSKTSLHSQRHFCKITRAWAPKRNGARLQSFPLFSVVVLATRVMVGLFLFHYNEILKTNDWWRELIGPSQGPSS